MIKTTLLSSNRIYLTGLIATLCALIFYVDLRIPLGVAVGVPYLLPVFVSSRLPGAKAPIWTALLCTVLAVLGFYYSAEGGLLWQVLLNRALALFVIWAAAFYCFFQKQDEKRIAMGEMITGIEDKNSTKLLAGGFFMLITMTTLVELGAIRIVDSIAGLTKELHEHPFTVSNNLLEVNNHIISMHRYMKDVALAQNPEELELAVSLVDRNEAEIHKHFEIIEERFLGDKTRIKEVRQLFSDWEPIRSEVIELTRAGKNNEAAIITKGKGATYVAKLTLEMDGLIEFANNMADTFYTRTLNKQAESKMYLYEWMSIILITGLFIAYFIIRKIKENSKELRDSEERYRSISMSSSIAMVVTVDHLDTIVSWNPAAEKIFEYSEAEILNRPLTDIMPERYRSAHTKGFQRASKSDEYRIIGKTVELHGLKKSGEEFPLELSLSTWKQGGKKYFSGIIHDITERKQAEKKVERFSRIFEDSLNEIYLFDAESLKFVQMNSAAQQNLGFSMEELQELTPLDIKPEFTSESFAKMLVPLRKGEKDKIVFETVHQRKDKSLYDVEVHLQLLKYYHEELFVAFILDITDKKKQEAALSQAQKMEAVGQLTGGIAHDFNNLLSIISGNLRFLRQDVGETSQDIDELFEDATSAVNDGAELTQRLLGFSRNRTLHPETQNVNDTIDKSARFLSRTLGENTDLETVLPDEDLFISVDSSQLENALLNLCINARDAMPQGGTITVSTEHYYHGNGNGNGNEYSLSLPEGNYVKISVADTGSGINPEDLQHVYEPFFTTKEVGKGSGLGLSMVYGFIQQSSGGCHIESTPGEGTMVSMYFPEVKDDEIIDQKTEEKEKFLHGTEVILVVEDEPRVRRVALRDLNKLGYKTLEAENADMAKTIIESGEPVDLLFSDIIMSGEMDGHMLAVWTEEHYPQIKIVLTSGYSKGKADVSSDKAHPFPLLRKPYSIENLTQQIRAALVAND